MRSSQRQSTVLRQHAHKRKVVNVAHAVVSDDPHHDTGFVQAAIPQINKWIDDSRTAIKCGVVLEHLVRSDGARLVGQGATSRISSRCSS
jgi:hypothetical protein